MTWLARLKALPQGCGLPRHPRNPQNPSCEGFEGAQVVHTPFGDGDAQPSRIDSDDAREAFEERAAILEFDGGLNRAEAERRARELHLANPKGQHNQGGASVPYPVHGKATRVPGTLQNLQNPTGREGSVPVT